MHNLLNEFPHSSLAGTFTQTESGSNFQIVCTIFFFCKNFKSIHRNFHYLVPLIKFVKIFQSIHRSFHYLIPLIIKKINKRILLQCILLSSNTYLMKDIDIDRKWFKLSNSMHNLLFFCEIFKSIHRSFHCLSSSMHVLSIF